MAVLALLAAVAAGAALGMWFEARVGRDRNAVRIATLGQEVTALRERVADEAAERARLALEAKRLREALADTQRAPADGALASERAARSEREPRGAEVIPPVAATAGNAHEAAGVSGAPAFDPAPLLAAGYRADDVERFRGRLDEIELDRLYLRDRAAREGWLETPRFRDESRAIGQEFLGLRDEFDEGLYDWALFSSGHPNRVAVTEVLSGSAAQSAGLTVGDVIVRYDDRLVLSTTELRDATAAGREGELVAVEVQRTGDPAPVRIFVPRGPLGVRMAPASVEPPPAG